MTHTKQPIVVWGMPTESTLRLVLEALGRIDAPVALIDQRAVLQTELSLEVGANIGGTLTIMGHALDLATVGAAYIRPYNGCDLPWIAAAGPESAAWQQVRGLEAGLWLWTDLAPALVINRPAATSSNGSKPYQLELIRQQGWDVPPTLVTTDPAAVLAFWETHGEIIYKSISGVRSKVTRLQPAQRDRLAQLASCPTQFQAHIAGDDYRVHVVGEAVFGCQISSSADDYRYAQTDRPTLRAIELPPLIAAKCHALAHSLDLPVAGIDLRRTPADQWFCFEVNPSPAFSYYERATEQPISTAIAQLLTTPSLK